MRKTKICINAYRIPKYITTIKAANEVEIEVLYFFCSKLVIYPNFLGIYPLKPW